MLLFFSIVVFLFGLIIGSFLNCVIYRLETNDSFLRGRSFCPNCKHALAFHDLIPVLSFLFLRGRCRYCRKPISWQYPIVEIATAILFLLIFNFQLPSVSAGEEEIYLFALQFPDIVYYWIISAFLIIIFVHDLKHYLIPDSVIYVAIAVTFFYQLFRVWNLGNYDLSLISDLGLGILPSFFLLAIILISRGRWMGMGDFKLALLMGLILGWPSVLLALFLAFFIGAAVGIGLIATGAKTLKSEVPFGPFLVTGTFLAMLFGKEIVNWYLTFFLLQ